LSDQEQKNPRGPLLVAAAAVLLGIVVWWFAKAPARVPEPVADPEATAADAVADSKPPVPAPAPAPSAAFDFHDELPVHPAGSASADGMMRPHPITPQHERIFRENQLIGQLNGAMDVKDAKGMRRLLAEYREEYPEDEHVMQRGYELIADCLESPGEATRAVAKKYYDTELASGLRRYIRRHCLEN
jgi:hypothetical protein